MNRLFIISLIFLPFILCCTKKKQQPISLANKTAKATSTTKEISKRDILKLAFNCDSFIGEEALWKPSIGDEDLMLISYDGYCHTLVDTIMDLSSDSLTQKKGKGIVFKTIRYVKGNVRDDTACVLSYITMDFTSNLPVVDYFSVYSYKAQDNRQSKQTFYSMLNREGINKLNGKFGKPSSQSKTFQSLDFEYIAKRLFKPIKFDGDTAIWMVRPFHTGYSFCYSFDQAFVYSQKKFSYQGKDYTLFVFASRTNKWTIVNHEYPYTSIALFHKADSVWILDKFIDRDLLTGHNGLLDEFDIRTLCDGHTYFFRNSYQSGAGACCLQEYYYSIPDFTEVLSYNGDFFEECSGTGSFQDVKMNCIPDSGYCKIDLHYKGQGFNFKKQKKYKLDLTERLSYSPKLKKYVVTSRGGIGTKLEF